MKERSNVILLGKGKLAVLASAWFKSNAHEYDLKFIIPDQPEPTWTDSITEWAQEAKVPIIGSGKHEDVPLNIKIDLAVSIFYGRIIKSNFIQRCEKIINLHNGPLPKYRGVRPINWALKNKEIYHGVTIHKITKGIDEGNILGQVTYPIYPDIEEVEDVYNKSQEYGWLLFKDVMKNFKQAYKYAKKQHGEPSYYSSKDSPKLGDRINWRRTED